MKILIVEDEAKTGDYLKQGLSEAGFTADLVRNGVDGMHEGLAGEHDLLILDVNLPGLDGWQVLKALRAAGRELPVLFLTAKDAIEDRVAGLRAGCDDYLVKPFAFAELLARAEALLRRALMPAAPHSVLRASDLEIDLPSRCVTRGGRAIQLSATEFQLLEFLMRHAGQVVTRRMLLERVWNLHFDPQVNLVDAHLERLRQAIDRGFDHSLLHTVRGAGYVLRA